MGKDISIALTLADKMSAGISSAGKSAKAFGKDMSAVAKECALYDEAQKKLTKDSGTLKTALEGSKIKVNEAKKAYKQYGDELHQGIMDNAISEQVDMQRQLKDTDAMINSNRKSFVAYRGEIGKTDNRAGGIIGLGKGLATSGIGQLVSGALSQLTNAQLSSAIGEPDARLTSSIVSGAISGGTMGAIWGHLGIAIGTVLGGIAGVMNGYAEIFEVKDDAFKSVVQDRYNTAQDAQKAQLSSGTELAAKREQDLVSFTTLFGSRDTAENYLADIRDFANVTPFLYDDLTAMSKTLKTYGYDEKEMMPTLTAVGDAGSALGMNADDMKMVATGLGRMRTSGKTNAEYMNLLLERGIPVYDYLGEGLNKTKAQVIEMLSKGDIGGAMAAQIITDYMGTSFKGSMNEQAKTFSGLESTVMGLKQNMDAALGEGYTEERKSGLSSEIEYYSGESGAQEEKANRLMGQWKASLENTHNQMQLDFKAAIMTGVMPDNLDAELTKKLRAMNIDYTWLSKNGGDGAGAKMGGILAESMVLAENEYMASEGALLEIETQKALVKAVRDDTAVKEEYWKSGYDLQQEFTKGQKAANERYGIDQFKPQVVDPMSNPKFAAYAGRYMPLPAADSPRSSNTTVNINGTYQVRSDADVAAVAQELARKINQYSSVTVQ